MHHYQRKQKNKNKTQLGSDVFGVLSSKEVFKKTMKVVIYTFAVYFIKVLSQEPFCSSSLFEETDFTWERHINYLTKKHSFQYMNIIFLCVLLKRCTVKFCPR